jgi:transcriptional regulator with XRE-family HTH domain
MSPDTLESSTMPGDAARCAAAGNAEREGFEMSAETSSARARRPRASRASRTPAAPKRGEATAEQDLPAELLDPRELARRLDQVLKTRVRPDGRSWTLRQVAEAVSETGVALSASYLSQLSKGRRVRPSGAILAALARFFEVPVTYFLPGSPAEVDTAQVSLELIRAMQRNDVREVAIRAANLPEANVQALIAFIAHLETAAPPASKPSPPHQGATPLAAATKPSRSRTAAAPRRTSHPQSPVPADPTDVRSWARANGYQIGDRGRVPADVRAAYEAAH